MAFSDKQINALQRKLDSRHVRSREINGREIWYIEARHAFAEANRIFGFDGWCRETIETRCVLARENRGIFLAIYIAKVRVTVRANGVAIIRDGHGTGEGRGPSPGDVHGIALKAAETDGTKRALVTFGKAFGLELYGNANGQSNRNDSKRTLLQLTVADRPPGLRPDDTAPLLPRSGHCGHQHLEIREQTSIGDAAHHERDISTEPVATELTTGGIDKSVLTFGEPKRLRNKAHLRFVGSQPCLICGRQPADAHHLRFTQPRALGRKVSDEFTVPLCRGHHRQVHQTGNEAAWWTGLNINVVETARELWEQSHSGVR